MFWRLTDVSPSRWEKRNLVLIWNRKLGGDQGKCEGEYSWMIETGDECTSVKRSTDLVLVAFQHLKSCLVSWSTFNTCARCFFWDLCFVMLIILYHNVHPRLSLFFFLVTFVCPCFKMFIFLCRCVRLFSPHCVIVQTNS